MRARPSVHAFVCGEVPGVCDMKSPGVQCFRHLFLVRRQGMKARGVDKSVASGYVLEAQ